MRQLPYLRCYIICNRNDLIIVHLMNPVHIAVRRFNRIHNLRQVEQNFLSITLDHIRLHVHTHYIPSLSYMHKILILPMQTTQYVGSRTIIH